jgi:hypothetical protein
MAESSDGAARRQGKDPQTNERLRELLVRAGCDPRWVSQAWRNDLAREAHRRGAISQRQFDVVCDDKVIKCRLDTLASARVREALRDFSSVCTALMRRASYTANLTILRMWNAGELANDAALRRAVSPEFARHYILPEYFGDALAPEVQATRAQHGARLDVLRAEFDWDAVMGRGAWQNGLAYLATAYVQNLTWAVILPFNGRAKRYLRRMHPEHAEAAVRYLFAREPAANLPHAAVLTVERLKAAKGLQPTQSLEDADSLKALTLPLFRAHMEMAAELGFGALPICSFRRSFARVDASQMWGAIMAQYVRRTTPQLAPERRRLRIPENAPIGELREALHLDRAGWKRCVRAARRANKPRRHGCTNRSGGRARPGGPKRTDAKRAARRRRRARDVAARKARTASRAALKRLRTRRAAGVGSLPPDAIVNSIMSDGVGLVVVLKVPKLRAPVWQTCPAAREAELEEARGLRDAPGGCVLGGAGNVAVHTTVTSEGASHRLHNRDLQSRSGALRFRRFEVRRTEAPAVRRALSAMSAHTHRTVDEGAFAASLEACAESWPDLFAEYAAPTEHADGWCDWRMKLYSGKKRVLAQSVGQVLRPLARRGRAVVLGYGNGSRVWGIRGTDSAPQKKMLLAFRQAGRELRMRLSVVVVHEAYTTMKCHRCHAVMEAHRRRSARTGRVEEVRGFRVCTNPAFGACGHTSPKLRNRDLNAAHNIMEVLRCLLDGEERPPYLCRR